MEPRNHPDTHGDISVPADRVIAQLSAQITQLSLDLAVARARAEQAEDLLAQAGRHRPDPAD
jgi:hypothetical protein